MELTSSALTAALVGVIIVLTKVIDWLMNRNGNGKAKASKDFNGYGEVLTKIEAKLDMLADGMQEMRQGRMQMVEQMASLASGQERVIERLGDVVNGMERVADNVAGLRSENKQR
jgi:uncharacterized protein Yka (UPF0111/DUF47 family)